MNNRIKERWIGILKILYNRTSPITISELGRITQVSNRTIRNDLNDIDELFKEKDISFIKRKPGVGIWIEINKEQEDKFKEIIYSKVSYIQPYYPKERKKYILSKLLGAKKPITMEELGNKLFVSRITILKDLNQIEKDISKYKVSILRKQNYGVEIKGEEKDIRRLMGDIISKEEVQPFVKKIICNVEKELEFKLLEESVVNLSQHILISIERSKLNKTIEFSKDIKIELINEKEYKIAKIIGKRLEDAYKILLPEEEILYITIHLLGSKFELRDVNYGNENVDFAKEIIELVGNILSVDLINDKQLLEGLTLHLKPTINRLRFGLNIENPLLEEVKENYPSIFGASWATSALFDKYYGVKVPEEEIAYIAIHIGAALERHIPKTKVVVVCSSGVGTSQLVSIRLEKAISNLDIVDVISKQELPLMNDDNFDLIISTVDIDYCKKPIIRVSPFVNYEDVKKIKGWIDLNRTKKHTKRNDDLKNTSKLFKASLIFPSLNLKSKEEVITFLINELINEGYVKDKYLKETLERELITSTSIGKGIAIPHGNPKSVLKQTVAIGILDTPIDWSGDMVDIVLIIAFRDDSKDVVKNAFREFYNMLDNEEKIKKLRNVKNRYEAYNLLTDIS